MIKNMKDNNFKHDFYRWYGKTDRNLKEYIFQPIQLKYMFYFRKYKKSKEIKKVFYKIKLNHLSQKTSIDIPLSAEIGRGFYIMHLGGIVVNGDCKIGEYVNINSGAVLGGEIRGKRAGAPQIGNYCYIGKNAIVVRNIKIGDDVLIAPGAYVNFNVPAHSIVLGNPGKIIHKEHATEGYIYNILNEDKY